MARTDAFAVNLDCKNTENFLQDALCSDDRLGRLLDKVNDEYEKTMKEAQDPNVVRNDQMKVIVALEQCRDVACIEQVSIEALEKLKEYPTRGSVAQTEARNDPSWPPSEDVVKVVFYLKYYIKWPVLWIDDRKVEGVVYRHRSDHPEITEVVHKLTGHDLLQAGVLNTDNFEVADFRETVDDHMLPVYQLSYNAHIVANKDFMVVATKSGNEWKPEIVPGNNTSLNYAVSVRAGAILDRCGWMRFVYHGKKNVDVDYSVSDKPFTKSPPPQVAAPGSPAVPGVAQGPEASPWWKK